MSTNGKLHIIYLIGLLCMGAGIFLHLIGIASSSWSINDGPPVIYYGLWDMCVAEICTEYKDEFKTASLCVCQAFAAIGIVVGGATLVMSLVFALMTILNKSPTRILPPAIMITGASALVSILICVVTWAAGMPMKHEVRQAYSFALSLVGGIIIFTGGVLIFLGSK